jgi:hypothetical protein
MHPSYQFFFLSQFIPNPSVINFFFFSSQIPITISLSLLLSTLDSDCCHRTRAKAPPLLAVELVPAARGESIRREQLHRRPGQELGDHLAFPFFCYCPIYWYKSEVGSISLFDSICPIRG